MILFLLTTLTTLTTYTATAHPTDGLFRKRFTDTEDVMDDVLTSVNWPTRQQEPTASDLNVLLNFFTRPSENLKQEAHELKTLIKALNRAKYETEVKDFLEAAFGLAEEPTPDDDYGREEDLGLNDDDTDFIPAKKRKAPRIQTRSCTLRLGGHCRTQALDQARKQYEFLMSPHSPGRRKRRSLHNILTNQQAPRN